MTAGMVPLALGWGEGGEQTAPLGRAVIGGLVAATIATLLVLPAIFAIAQVGAARHSSSVDPDDPRSRYYDLQAGSPSGSSNGHAGAVVAMGGPTGDDDREARDAQART
jgi:hypothetical protein